jgi:ubiquinone/menaquinone biosynthesis C-methylase UbiE
VNTILAVEPDSTAHAAAEEWARSARVPIAVVEGFAEALPAGDESFEAAVVMGVLCSVPNAAPALQELRRVLVPGGELRFWEHVRSRNALFHGFQRATDSLFWTKALAGCETTRDTESAIRAAGFEFVALDHGFHSSSLLTIPCAPYVLGIARS